MGKIILTTLLTLWVSLPLYAWGDYPQKKSDRQESLIQKRMEEPSNQPPAKISEGRLFEVLQIPCEAGAVQCDLERKGFRNCESGYFGSWIWLSETEAELAENCIRECVPGQYRCPLPDPVYKICTEAGRWWPSGSEWARIDEETLERVEQIRAACLLERDRHCHPGQYRCFRGGGYNRCDEDGNWVHGGGVSEEFITFRLRCLSL